MTNGAHERVYTPTEQANPCRDGIGGLAHAVGAMHPARIAAAHPVHREALHAACFLQAQAQRTAAAAGYQFRYPTLPQALAGELAAR